MTSTAKLIKSLFPSLIAPEEERQNNLKDIVTEHGWCLETGAAHFSLHKEYDFKTKREASEFLIEAVSDKNSNHVHLELVLTKSAKLDVSVYSDDNEHDKKCLQMCLELDDKYKNKNDDDEE